MLVKNLKTHIMNCKDDLDIIVHINNQKIDIRAIYFGVGIENSDEVNPKFCISIRIDEKVLKDLL